MPLPAALLARLKKRGIVQKEHEEEVIAESYDDDAASHTNTIVLGTRTCGAPGCPNKWNPFHICVEYCWDHWGDGTLEERLDESYTRKRLRMLRKYPLPSGWKEVYDCGIGRHYYWNEDTDEVSWLSPSHPRAVIGEAATRLAKAAFDKIDKAKRDVLIRATAAPLKERRRQKPPTPQPSDSSDSDSDDELEKRPKKKKRRTNLDPMDPASYGECQRGSWSSGLDTRGEAKTGADTTASGPLFQSRPYPAPGAILRQNSEMKNKRK